MIKYKPNAKEYAHIFSWDGEGWKSERHEVKYGLDMEIATGNNYFSIAHQAWNDVSAYTWNGESWYNSLKRVNCGDRDRYDYELELETNFDFFVESHPMWLRGDGTNTRKREKFGIHYWHNNNWYTKGTRLQLDRIVQKKFAVSNGATVGCL